MQYTYVPAAESGERWYKWRLVEQTLAKAAPMLGLNPAAIAVYWFLPTETLAAAGSKAADGPRFESDPINGRATKRADGQLVMDLSLETPDGDLVWTVLHEAKHLAQLCRGHHVTEERRRWLENDAERWADETFGRWRDPSFGGKFW